MKIIENIERFFFPLLFGWNLTLLFKLIFYGFLTKLYSYLLLVFFFVEELVLKTKPYKRDLKQTWSFISFVFFCCCCYLTFMSIESKGNFVKGISFLQQFGDNKIKTNLFAALLKRS